MSKEIVKFGKSPVMFDTFTRRPGPVKTNMHYCPGCGHGILHKLIAEGIAARGIQENIIFIAPVGCAVFGYYYFNCGSISVPHGRAPAVATGISRACPEKQVISYQGDGDLGAIGFNEFIQAANRGEKITVFFVNNANYGMTGGQMAPTTLPGQKTTTSPYGRNVETDGYPMKVCEIVNSLDTPVYIERCALTSTANIMKAKKAVGKALDNLRDRKGFSLVEFLCGCPVNLKKSSEEMNRFIEDEMMKYFPLGCLRDRSAETAPNALPADPIHDQQTVKSLLFPEKLDIGVDESFRNVSKIFERELRIKTAGFGGQGILSLGTMIANMAKLRNFNVSWLPSYGPEQRGGSANCSIIVSRKKIGSPIIDSACDVLIAISQTALDKFKNELAPGGILIYDSSTMTLSELPDGVSSAGVDATNIARGLGNAKCANAVLLGVLAAILDKKGILEGDDQADFDRVFNEAVFESFSTKPEVIELNKKAYAEGRKIVLS